jgi:glycosidase
MGVEILWFMPITPISEKNKKGSLGSYYACASYTTINPSFGTLQHFKALVNDAHSKGMKVIIDWVANHTGCDHEWTIEHPEFYYKNEAGEFYDKNGWDDVIDLDYSNAELRNNMIQSMQYWINECNIDGFRCDMAHLVPLDFWSEARTACDKLKSLFWLAETDDLNYHKVFDATYAWHWMHVSEKFFKGEVSMHDFRNALQVSEQLPEGCYKLMFTTNHDENSWNGTEFEKYGAAAKALAVLCNTWKALPLVYSGQEMPNHKRLKFFDKDEIEWKDELAFHSFYKALLQLRGSKAIAEGAVEILPTQADDKVLAYIKKAGEDAVLVLLNFSSAKKIRVRLQHESLQGNFLNVFSNLSFHFNTQTEFELNPWEYFVYRKKSN